MFKPKLIISGGQTGADQGGLEGARLAGIRTGGTAPQGYRTEAGNNPTLLRDQYGLKESPFSDYKPRTLQNVKDSDGTVVMGNAHSPGSKLTIRYCSDEKKPCIINPTVEQLVKFVEDHKIESLNIAGNRESKNPGIYEKTKKLIVGAFGDHDA